ncbi:MAG: Gfo/Idh/MocA family protein, partial [Alkalispirochaetaceae bacterium]
MKIGMIGAGFMARTHLAGWRALGEEVVGLLGYQDPTTDAFAKESRLPTFATFEQLARNCDVVDVCSPTFTHKQYVLAAVHAGRAVFCEKPLALSLADGREMVEAAKAAGVPFGVGHVLRFFPEYVKAAATARSGELGELAVLRFSRCTFTPKTGWYLDESRSGGVILDLMIHDLDFARYVA